MTRCTVDAISVVYESPLYTVFIGTECAENMMMALSRSSGANCSSPSLIRFATAEMKPGCVFHLPGRAHTVCQICNAVVRKASAWHGHLSSSDHLKSFAMSRRSSSRHRWFMLDPVVVHDHCGYCCRVK